MTDLSQEAHELSEEFGYWNDHPTHGEVTCI